MVRSPVLIKATTGMPGMSLTSPRRSTSDGAKRNASYVVAHSSSLILRDIRRYKADVAFNFGSRAHIECGKPQGCGLPEIQLIDVLRRNLDFDHERIRIGYDQHDRITRGDYTRQPCEPLIVGLFHFAGRECLCASVDHRLRLFAR